MTRVRRDRGNLRKNLLEYYGIQRSNDLENDTLKTLLGNHEDCDSILVQIEEDSGDGLKKCGMEVFYNKEKGYVFKYDNVEDYLKRYSREDQKAVKFLVLDEEKVLLRRYYCGSGCIPIAEEPDELDINRREFNAELYVRKLMKEKTAEKLVKTSNRISSQIKTLDNDLQKLVYENYNKFITATDTIKEMKKHVVTMEKEMDKLNESMKVISTKSKKINSNLEEKRNKIEKLSGISLMLTKMQFLLDLPQRLKTCLEEKAFSSAIKYYNGGKDILEQYKELPSIEKIYQETNVIIGEIKSILRKEIVETDSARKIEENFGHLYHLNEDADQLCQEYLAHHRKVIEDNIFKKFHPDEKKSILSNLKQLHDAFSNYFKKVVHYFHSIFTKDMDDSFHLWTINLWKDYQSQLNRVLLDIFSLEFILEQSNVEEHVSGQSYYEAWQFFGNSMRSLVTAFPDLPLIPFSIDYLKKILLHFIAVQRQYVETKIADVFKVIFSTKDTQEDLKSFIEDQGNMIKNLMCEFIVQQRRFLDSREEFLESSIEEIRAVINSSIFDLFQYIQNYFSSYIVHSRVGFYPRGYNTNEKTTLTGIILMSKLSSSFRAYINDVEKSLQKAHCIPKSKADHFENKISVLEKDFDDYVQKTLLYYIEQLSQHMTKYIQTGMDSKNWLEITTPPKKVRMMTQWMERDLEQVSNVLGQLYDDDTKSEASSDSSFFHSRSSLAYGKQPSTNNFGSSFFRKKEAAFSVLCPSDISRTSILKEIIKVSLKSYLEYVYETKFSLYGLQQIQVDLHSLKTNWLTILPESDFVSNQIDVILGICSQHCFENAQLLDENILNTLVENNSQKKPSSE